MSGSWLGKKWLLACNACVRPNVTHDNQQQIGYKENKEEQEKQLIGKKYIIRFIHLISGGNWKEIYFTSCGSFYNRQVLSEFQI